MARRLGGFGWVSAALLLLLPRPPSDEDSEWGRCKDAQNRLRSAIESRVRFREPLTGRPREGDAWEGYRRALNLAAHDILLPVELDAYLESENEASPLVLTLALGAERPRIEMLREASRCRSATGGGMQGFSWELVQNAKRILLSSCRLRAAGDWDAALEELALSLQLAADSAGTGNLDPLERVAGRLADELRGWLDGDAAEVERFSIVLDGFLGQLPATEFLLDAARLARGDALIAMLDEGCDSWVGTHQCRNVPLPREVELFSDLTHALPRSWLPGSRVHLLLLSGRHGLFERALVAEHLRDLEQAAALARELDPLEWTEARSRWKSEDLLRASRNGLTHATCFCVQAEVDYHLRLLKRRFSLVLAATAARLGHTPESRSWPQDPMSHQPFTLERRGRILVVGDAGGTCAMEITLPN